MSQFNLFAKTEEKTAKTSFFKPKVTSCAFDGTVCSPFVQTILAIASLQLTLEKFKKYK